MIKDLDLGQTDSELGQTNSLFNTLWNVYSIIQVPVRCLSSTNALEAKRKVKNLTA